MKIKPAIQKLESILLLGILLVPVLSRGAPPPATEKIWPEHLRGFTVGVPQKFLETAEPYERMASWHANLMTVNFAYDSIMGISKAEAAQCPPVPAEMEPYRGALARLDKVIRLAKAHGIYIVINGARSIGWDDIDVATGETTRESVETEQEYVKNIIKLHLYLSSVYKDEPTLLGYKFLAEPHTKWIVDNWATIVVPEFIKALRSVDTNTYFVFSAGLWGFPDFGSAKKGRIQVPVDDPANKTVYGFHHYAPQNYTHQGIGTRPKGLVYPGKLKKFNGSPLIQWDRKELKKYMQPALDFKEKYKVRMFVGECGVVRWAPGADRWLDDSISIFEENGVDWSCHNFAGSWDGWNVTVPADAPMGNVGDGHVDTPRLKVIKKHLAKK